MKLFKYILSLNLLLIVFITLPAVGQSPDQILAKIDSVQNAFSDMSATEQMKLIDEENRVKKRVVEIKQKGKELRMVRFLEPADVRGVGFLRLDSDRLYLYLPAFRKVRRIASSATNENFMGTDFTYEDMSQSVYADDYIARELSTQQGQYRLFLEPKPGADVNYHHLVIHADTSNFVLWKVEYHNRLEQKKELSIDNVEKIDGYWMGKMMRMVSLDENHETVLELSDIQFDQGLSDSEFSERSLKRPIR
ncbi:outer membrane lipoprotein-sorting protein [Halalkalibaculum sp. DA3122]|uniref:outer membrane lipoprotein-sorting protein n=1 Tax=Halalkalibaculum sp. DA3122 TaxID=3373607 RepID=UPI003754EBF6